MNLNCNTWRRACAAWIALLAGLPAGCADPASAHAAPAVVERRLSAMGTSLTLEVESRDRRAALSASESAVRAIQAVEERLSTWVADSELARLNAHPVEVPCALSDELARDLQRARHWWRETGGSFDPAVGPLVAAWDLRGAGRRPTDAELEDALGASGLEHLELRAGEAIRRLSGCTLEEGGFGKGVGLDAAADALRAAGVTRATLDLGGQVLRLGDAPGTPISIAHPAERGTPLCDLALRSGSVATSGNSERAIEVEGERHGHLLDPRTGRPAPDFGSVTVVAERGIDADCLATALFVMGPERALEFASRRDGIEAVVVEFASGAGAPRVRATKGLESRLTPGVENLHIEFVDVTTSTEPTSPER